MYYLEDSLPGFIHQAYACLITTHNNPLRAWKMSYAVTITFQRRNSCIFLNIDR